MKKVWYSAFKGNSNTRHEILNEDKARKKYEELVQKYYERLLVDRDVKIIMTVEVLGILVQPEIPWLAYSADGIVWASRVLVEIKCPVISKTGSAT